MLFGAKVTCKVALNSKPYLETRFPINERG